MAHLAKHKSTQPTHVRVTHAHAKPHRKRHYALLLASLALVVALAAFLLAYVNQAAIGRAVASQTIASFFGNEINNQPVTVSSSYGFTASYNANRYFASAIDAESGSLFVGDELTTERAYDTIRLSTQAAGYKVDTNSIKLTYYTQEAAPASVAEAEQEYIVAKQANAAQLTKSSTEIVTIDGVGFQRTEWLRELEVGGLMLKTTFVTFAGTLNNHPFTVIVYEGTQSGVYADAFMNDMTFTSTVNAADMTPTAAAIERRTFAERLIDTVLGAQVAGAASATPSYTSSERVSATYGPAVVKIYNVYAADLMLDGSVVYEGYMSGGTGSGFIVSADGYIATNGHVVVNDAREEIIKTALILSAAGKSELLAYLVELTSLQNSDIAGKTTDEARTIIIEALYAIDNSHFAFRNLQTNLLIGLGDKQVDIEELIERTENHQAYPEQDTIKKATVESYDFAGVVLPAYTGEFKSSDVALLKLTSGSNYPMVKIGTMADAAQGSNLNIMGFPGTGSSSNGIVSKTVTSATLTTGKVSAQKEDNGGRSMIETDTEIGHGNSGGPAFTDAGEVIGIATYTSDSGEAGDGVLNYIRDVADFTALADKKFVGYKTVSETQRVWNKAIDLFYEAHYKSAIPQFKKVAELYPEHPQVAAMIASSEKHIANGDNVDEFPIAAVVIVAAVALLGTGVAVVFIVLHNKKHQAYVHGVTTGQIQPMVQGMPAQTVAVPVAAAPVAVAQPVTPAPLSPPQPPVELAPVTPPVLGPETPGVVAVSEAPVTPAAAPVVLETAEATGDDSTPPQV